MNLEIKLGLLFYAFMLYLYLLCEEVGISDYPPVLQQDVNIDIATRESRVETRLQSGSNELFAISLDTSSI